MFTELLCRHHPHTINYYNYKSCANPIAKWLHKFGLSHNRPCDPQPRSRSLRVVQNVTAHWDLTAWQVWEFEQFAPSVWSQSVCHAKQMGIRADNSLLAGQTRLITQINMRLIWSQNTTRWSKDKQAENTLGRKLKMKSWSENWSTQMLSSVRTRICSYW